MTNKYKIKTRGEHFDSDGPKRILALDGGGLKGIVTLGFLQQIEDALRRRHDAGPEFRLAHYFDLIAGTSTGAIIAAALAKGMTVAEVTQYYLTMGEKVFNRKWFRRGLIRARYDDRKLRKLLKEVLGADTTLGDDSLLTGIVLMTKRMDTGSPWPLGNNPRGRYFAGSAEKNRVGNADYPLWQVVRASTAAPAFFDPETLIINEAGSRRRAVQGSFVDGGVSPFNNPALQAFMYATLDGYRVNWQTGADNMLIVSVGTGAADPEHTPSKIAAKGAVKALLSLMDDCAALVETIMQWMSSGTKITHIDRELGDLRDDLITAMPMFSYVRYNVSFNKDEVDRLKPGLSEKQIESLSAMDETENLMVWKELGELAAGEQVEGIDFPHRFDLPGA
ncbi:MAG: patatin-like phospholipase family protein [Woeseiaceae bacterium]|nr:patatin-like phospholipase family protein [Woeseiaceae bacterium]